MNRAMPTTPSKPATAISAEELSCVTLEQGYDAGGGEIYIALLNAGFVDNPEATTGAPVGGAGARSPPPAVRRKDGSAGGIAVRTKILDHGLAPA